MALETICDCKKEECDPCDIEECYNCDDCEAGRQLLLLEDSLWEEYNREDDYDIEC